jgi:hypothetical protein
VASNYVSAIWEGFILPTYSEMYSFYTESNDGIRVYVNDVLVTDSLVDSSTDTDTQLIISLAISLTAGKLVPIKVMYYQNTGVAMVTLSWESTS